MEDKNLLFIVSQPRSGSTLLQALLSNNNFVATVSEPWLLLPHLSILRPDLVEAKYDFRLAVLGINDFARKVGGENLLKHEIHNFALNFYSKIKKEETAYVLDKTPRYYEVLDELVDVFPKAKILLLKRHPFAVLNSIIDTWLTKKDINQLLQYERDVLHAPLLLYSFLSKHQNNPNVLGVKYEDIVANPLLHINEIYNWIDIPFEESVLNYEGNKSFRGLMGDPTGIHQNKKPEINSLDSWKSKLEDEYWGGVMKGYGQFLGQEFLLDYGPYEYHGGKNKLFDEFLFLHKFRTGFNKISLKDHLKYKLYKETKINLLFGKHQ